MSETDAATYAQNVWIRTNAEAMSSTITSVSGLHTVDGQFRPAPLVRAGDWIDVIDLPGHVPVYITGSTYSQEQNMVTITTGNREQVELVVPGRSALPAELKAYGEGGEGGGSGLPSGGGSGASGSYTWTGDWMKDRGGAYPGSPSGEKGSLWEYRGGGVATGRAAKEGWMWVTAGEARVTSIDGEKATSEWISQGEILVPIK